MGVVTLFVSTSRTATLGPPVASASLEPSGLDTATAGRPAAVAAIELMRKWRLFIGYFHFGFPGSPSVRIRRRVAPQKIRPRKSTTRSRMDLSHTLLKQRRRELIQIDAPVGPSVTAGALRVIVIDSGLLELGGKVLALGDANDGVVLAVAYIVELHASLLEGRQLIADIGRGAHAEHADIAEHIRVGIGGRERVSAAHGEAGDRAAILICDHAITLLDVRHHIIDQDFGESAAEGASAPARVRSGAWSRRGSRSSGCAWRRAAAGRKRADNAHLARISRISGD